MRHAFKHGDPLAGAAAGLIAGLGAAFVMEAFQNKVSELRRKAEAAKQEAGGSGGSGEQESEPSTEKAADKISQVATGVALPKAYNPRPVGPSITRRARRSGWLTARPPSAGRA